MPEFPDKVFGRCPLGHNPQPSGTTGNDISTTQIGEGEEQPLHWSTYHQKYVCAMHLRRVQDLKDDAKFHTRQVEIAKSLAGMGIEQA
jgi:hypothetical protein